MLTSDQINTLLNVDDPYKAPGKLMKILFDKEKREALFRDFLEYETKMDYDWFHIYYQEEQAQRKTHKQDFTPNSISELIAKIAGSKPGSNLDVAAGTGGLTIQKWHHDQRQVSPFEYWPSNYFYQCEELSDRALPFLLFNMAIRGMNGTVVFGDTLERKVKQVYYLQNDSNDFLGFSSLNVMPHTLEVEKEFRVYEWLESEIDHIESPNPWKELEKLGQQTLDI